MRGAILYHGAVSGMEPEPILEPELPIVDPHHHLWLAAPGTLEALKAQTGGATELLYAMYSNRPRFLFEDLLEDTSSGHDVRATVFVEAGAMYRADGPEELRSVGEVEFVNGVGAMAASGLFGETRHCAGIVGRPDLRLGDGVRPVLEAHLRAAPDRYRGVRNTTTFEEHRGDLWRALGGKPHLLLDSSFRAALHHVQELGLSCDISLSASQLPELVDLARALPELQIVLNHLGGPVAIDADGSASQEYFQLWREKLPETSDCPNISVKLGGLGNPLSGLPAAEDPSQTRSEALARVWRPYIETCIEAFGPERCMFESNFPVDGMTASYRVLWNTFKRIASGASASEKAALFSETARRVYRLDA